VHLGRHRNMDVLSYKETTGFGIEGIVNGKLIKLGSYQFLTGDGDRQMGTSVFVSIDNSIYGYFSFRNYYRDKIIPLLKDLQKRYRLSVLSGDNDAERELLQAQLGPQAIILFHQRPEDKLNYISLLQKKGEKVMMVGDGLNDAAALRQSNVGIAVTDQTNNFTPASDGIIRAEELTRLDRFIRLCQVDRNIIVASFVLSIVYNIIGLFFAVQGNLSPLVAAILMPSSSLSILLLTFGSSHFIAKRLKL